MNGRPDGSALVTGASRGIGAAIARALAREGWPVGVNYRSDEAAAAAVVDEITKAGGRAKALHGDIADPDAAEALFSALEEEFGPVLVLVNNAGVRADGLAPMIDDDDWDRVVDTNLSAAFRLTRRALRPMIRSRYGRVVNIASIVGGVRADGLSPQIDDEDWARVIDTNLNAAFRLTRRALRPMIRNRFGRVVNIASVVGTEKANPGQANYAASKAGLVAMTKTVATEVARRNVTVNAVAPGLIETDMTEDLGDGLLALVPARRAGTPDDVAACVRFLTSTDAGYVTGVCLTVDGGLTA